MIFKNKFCFLFVLLFAIVSCKSQVHNSVMKQVNAAVLNDTTFVNLKEYSDDFVYDMKYATEDNFLKAKVYDCAECYLRLKTVVALVEANKEFTKKGYRIKLFDCYRPLDIQKKMWKIVSNPQYVADPTKGSIHNRGGAVDITLIDAYGAELDMGTTFDFFGVEASHSYTKLSEKVKENRLLLKSIMTTANFNSFDSEWWHYNLKSALKDKVSNVKWDCE
ncbi:M15 family metallopeptidase [Flavobacterium sp. ACAM 123]|uniref:M15 family metallopeptidase n=1 Tax=Flavobacterium sp. ACAM 123 TaxID=1189620 RepID=UPI00036BAE27